MPDIFDQIESPERDIFDSLIPPPVENKLLPSGVEPEKAGKAMAHSMILEQPAQEMYNFQDIIDKEFQNNQIAREEEPRNPISEIDAAIRFGGYGTVENYLRAARVFGIDTTDKIQTIKEMAEPWEPSRHGPVWDSITGGFRSTVESVLAGIPGAGIGFIFGAGVGAVPGFALGAGGLFTLAEYDRFMEEAEAIGLKREDVKIEALVSAIAEGGIEAATDLIGAKIFGLIGSPAIKGPVKQGLIQAANRFFKRLGTLAGVEVPGEMITSAIQAYEREQVEIPTAEPWEAAKQAIGPSLVQTILMAGMGQTAATLKERLAKADKESQEERVREKEPSGAGGAFGEIVSRETEEVLPEKPTIPEFEGTEEAEAFGREATPEQIEQLKTRLFDDLVKAREMKAEDRLKAGQEKTQLDREALQEAGYEVNQQAERIEDLLSKKAPEPLKVIPTDIEIDTFFKGVPAEEEAPGWFAEIEEEGPPADWLIGPEESLLETEKDEYEVSKDFKDHLEGYLGALQGMVGEGEPGRRFRREADYGTPGYEWFGFKASYPDFMLKRGWTAKQVMNAIQKALDHKKLGTEQERMVDAALEQAQEMFLTDVQEMTDWDPAEIEATIGPAIESFFGLPEVESEQTKRIKKHLAIIRKALMKKVLKAGTKKRMREITGITKPLRLVDEYEALKAGMKKAAAAARKAMSIGDKAGAAEMRVHLKEIAQRMLRKRKATQLKYKIQDLLKKTKVRKQAGKPVGKFTPDIQITLDKFREASKLTRIQAQTAIDNNLKKYEGQIPPSDIALENRIYQMLIESRTLETLETLYADIEGLINEGRMLNELKKFNRQSKEMELVNKAMDVITGREGLPEGISTVGVKKAKPETIKAHVKSFMASIGKAIVGWKDILDMLSGKDPSKPFESWLNKWADVLDAKDSEKKGNRVAMEKVRSAAMESYGLKTEHELIKHFQEDTNEVSLGTFTNEDGVNIELKFTKAEARKRWMEIQASTLEETFRIGMKYTDDIYRAIDDFLTPQDKVFALKQLDFYRDFYDSINTVYRDIYGVNLPKSENYSPIRRAGVGKEALDTFGEFFQEMSFRASVTSGSLISRVENVRPLKQISDVAILEQHIAEMEHFKAWALKMRELQAVFGNPQIRAAIEIEHGRPILSVVDNFLADFTRGGMEYASRLNWLDKIRANYTRAVLAVKGAILIKQLTSFIAYADAIPVTDFISGAVDFWENPVKKAKILMKTELMRARGKTIDRDLKTAMRTDEYSSWRKDTNNFMNTLLLNVQIGDKGAIVAGGWSVYKYYRDKKGFSHEAALRKFESVTESTQQSADLSELSVWQRAGSFAKLFTMFLSAPNQYFRKELGAFRNLAMGRGDKTQHAKTIVIYHILLPMLFQWVSDAFTWDKEEQKRAAILGPFNGIFIVGDILDQVIRKALGLRTFGTDVAVYSVGDDLARALKLVELADLTTEEVIRAIRGLAGGVGALTGKPLKVAVDMMQGAGNVLEGRLGAGLLELLGWSPYIAEKED